MAATVYTTAEVAAKFETDPRTLRKFLRSIDRAVGKGSRHSITGRDLAPLGKRFRKWSAETVAAKEAKVEAPAA